MIHGRTTRRRRKYTCARLNLSFIKPIEPHTSNVITEYRLTYVRAIVLVSISDCYHRAKLSAPPSCYFCKNIAAWSRSLPFLEGRLFRKPRLGAGRIRRKRSATSLAHGKLSNDKRRDGIWHNIFKLVPDAVPLLIRNGIKGSRRGVMREVNDKTTSPRVAPRAYALRGVRPWNCNLIASPASRPRGSDCRPVGRPGAICIRN